MNLHKSYFLLLLNFLMGCFTLQAQELPALTANDQERDEIARQQAAFAPSENEIDSLWSRGKKLLYHQNIHLGANVSFLAQRVSPSGKQTAFQGVYNPYLSWQVFEDDDWGSGEINLNYTLTHYWGTESVALQNRAQLAVSINNFEDNQKNFAQFSYTHTLPEEWDFLSVTLGQYGIDNFDGTQYMDDQQLYLVNHSLSQNETALYPDSSLGAYLQAQSDIFTAAIGYQDATNLSGAQVRFNDAFDGKYTTFGALIWTPSFELGSAQYGLLYYYQPAVEKRPESGHGWSFNAQQNIGNAWAVFARANGSKNGVLAVKGSYALGAALLNPLSRNKNDAILFAIGHNRLSTGVGNIHPTETILEAQWIFGFGKLLTLSPDLQFIPRAGLAEGHHSAFVAGLRATLLL